MSTNDVIWCHINQIFLMEIKLSLSLQEKLKDVYKSLQYRDDTKDLVIVIGNKRSIEAANESGQLGHVESNIIMHMAPTGKLQEGQVLVFKTDGSDPAVQQWGTKSPAVVSLEV
jgi:hypothetical protein